MKEKVFLALDNATANGFMISRYDDEWIAEDLTTYDADLEDCEPEELIPFIKEWKAIHQE